MSRKTAVTTFLLSQFFVLLHLVSDRMDGGLMSEEHKESVIKLNEKEIQLIQMIRKIGYGEMHIHVSDGKPIRAEEIRKSVKF
jgi:hypothetical protein